MTCIIMAASEMQSLHAANIAGWQKLEGMSTPFGSVLAQTSSRWNVKMLSLKKGLFDSQAVILGLSFDWIFAVLASCL
jgi:hypothetical protein